MTYTYEAQASQFPQHVIITSPMHNQIVTLDSLTVYGRSSDTVIDNCIINILVNGIELFRPANPTGVGGINDYSKWELTLTSNNSPLRQGSNMITAKYSCIDNPSLISGYSIQVNWSPVTLEPIPAPPPGPPVIDEDPERAATIRGPPQI
jgi:hypothetical protein